MDLFIDFCNRNNIRFVENARLSDYLSFKVGGPCKAMVFPDTADKIIACIRYLRSEKLKYYIIGNGTNLLAYDEGYDGIIINTSDYSELAVDGEYITCSSGVSMMKICRLALENSLSGLEFAYGIPGTAGGAVYMNAGAYGGEMKDVLVKCEHLDSELNEGSFSGEDLQLGYRHSIYSENDYVITSLTLKMKKGNYDDIKALMDENLSKRKAKQPLDFPSAGSTFKRPDGYFAGALIEQCNLKGYCIGDAQVSEKHAGFVINKGNATTSDILKLIKHIQKTVFENKGVMLETEVKYFE
jgi:UDP-N-acetylmuramate dehydrogenase